MPIAADDPAAGQLTELAPRPGYPGSDPVHGTFNDSTGSGRIGLWLWTGYSWSYHAEHPAPGIPGSGVLAADPASGGMLYFSYTPPAPSYGGSIPRDPSGTRHSQTWLWQTGTSPASPRRRAPQPGDAILMAGDARVGLVVVTGVAGRLWEWSGSTWRPLASGRGPQAGGAAVYDAALGDLVVFGTRTNTSRPTSQTWLWNGTRWYTGP